MSGQSGGSAGMSGVTGGIGGRAGAQSSGGTGGSAGSISDGGPDEDGDTEESIDGADDSGDSEVTPDPTGPVVGKVIDYYENPVPDIQVTLNGVTVITDADGEFGFGATPATYSISLSLELARFGGAELAGYLFVDLTRRDPTLQVYHGLSRRSGDVTRNVDGVTFPLPNDEEIAMDFAGTYGGFEGELTQATITGSGDWEGPAEVQGHVHAIRYVNASSAPNVPTTYLAHDSQPLALDDNSTASFTVDLSSTSPLAADLISGEVTSGGVGGRYNHVFVRFADDAAVEVISVGASAAAYSYLVPSIPNGSIAIAAARNYQSFPPFAVAYRDGVAPGATAADLEIPEPATLVSPGPAATNIDENTVFRGPDGSSLYVRRQATNFRIYYVITARKEAQLPLSGDLARLVHNTAYTGASARICLRDRGRRCRPGWLPGLVLLRPHARPPPRLRQPHGDGDEQLHEHSVSFRKGGRSVPEARNSCRRRSRTRRVIEHAPYRSKDKSYELQACMDADTDLLAHGRGVRSQSRAQG